MENPPQFQWVNCQPVLRVRVGKGLVKYDPYPYPAVPYPWPMPITKCHQFCNKFFLFCLIIIIVHQNILNPRVFILLCMATFPSKVSCWFWTLNINNEVVKDNSNCNPPACCMMVLFWLNINSETMKTLESTFQSTHAILWPYTKVSNNLVK